MVVEATVILDRTRLVIEPSLPSSMYGWRTNIWQVLCIGCIFKPAFTANRVPPMAYLLVLRQHKRDIRLATEDCPHLPFAVFMARP